MLFRREGEAEYGSPLQVIARHQEVSGAAGASASHLGFPTGVARQRHEAKARTLLACWIADTGQGFQEDVESASLRSSLRRHASIPCQHSSLATAHGQWIIGGAIGRPQPRRCPTWGTIGLPD